MFKYGTIAKVILLTPGNEKVMSHLLLAGDNSFQVDLTGDFLFNELIVYSVLGEDRVDSLTDLYEYLYTHGIRKPLNLITKEGLFVGGERDFLISEGLVANWYENAKVCS